jgi:glycogen operon protein
MFVAGDEFGRSQGGNNNAYNQDNPTSWIDWAGGARFADLEHFTTRLLALRSRHPVLWDERREVDVMRVHGANGDPDVSFESRSIAWSVDGLYVMANMWWEPVEFTVREPGSWTISIDTADPTAAPVPVGERVVVGPRSVVVLERTPNG